MKPHRMGAVATGYENKKFQTPEGLKIVHKWLHSETKCIEIVEADCQGGEDEENPFALRDYTQQFDEYGTYEIVPLIDAREAIPGLTF